MAELACNDVRGRIGDVARPQRHAFDQPFGTGVQPKALEWHRRRSRCAGDALPFVGPVEDRVGDHGVTTACDAGGPIGQHGVDRLRYLGSIGIG